MILLDTNVVSAVMGRTPPPFVIEWLDRQDTATLHLTTVTLAEIGFGLRVLPRGKRQRALTDRFERFVALGFAHRVLSFDEPAARAYAEVMARRQRLGRPLSVPDGQIASIARANQMAVATRNVRDFEECGVDILNPFEEAS